MIIQDTINLTEKDYITNMKAGGFWFPKSGIRNIRNTIKETPRTGTLYCRYYMSSGQKCLNRLEYEELV
jgi:hypothetical protein